MRTHLFLRLAVGAAAALAVAVAAPSYACEHYGCARNDAAKDARADAGADSRATPEAKPAGEPAAIEKGVELATPPAAIADGKCTCGKSGKGCTCPKGKCRCDSCAHPKSGEQGPSHRAARS